jgi:hypothetical protein
LDTELSKFQVTERRGLKRHAGRWANNNCCRCTAGTGKAQDGPGGIKDGSIKIQHGGEIFIKEPQTQTWVIKPGKAQ